MDTWGSLVFGMTVIACLGVGILLLGELVDVVMDVLERTRRGR